MVGSRVSNASSRKIKKRGGNAAPEVVVLPVEVPPAPEIQKSGEEHHRDASTPLLFARSRGFTKNARVVIDFQKGEAPGNVPRFPGEKVFSSSFLIKRPHRGREVGK